MATEVSKNAGRASSDYTRNWLATVLLILSLVLRVAINVGTYIKLTIEAFKTPSWKDWKWYVNTGEFATFAVLTIALLIICIRAMTNPLFLHGVDSNYNIRYYKYYLYAVFFLFVFGVINIFHTAWKETGSLRIQFLDIFTLMSSFSTYLTDLFIYWCWHFKGDAKAWQARIFMPFLPKPTPSRRTSIA